MLLDSSDSRGFKLFGKHNEKPGQYGILFARKGVVALNRSNDEPGRRGGFISWEGYRFCRALLVDKRRSESFDYETSAFRDYADAMNAKSIPVPPWVEERVYF